MRGMVSNKIQPTCSSKSRGGTRAAACIDSEGSKNLNEGYVASRDLTNYAGVLRKVKSGEMAVKDGIMAMPKLKRMGGTCPCSKGVRWVMEDAGGVQATVAVRGN